MIATAFVVSCLSVRLHAACRVIGIVKRVPGKGPSGAVTEYRDHEYGCDEASKHLNTEGSSAFLD